MLEKSVRLLFEDFDEYKAHEKRRIKEFIVDGINEIFGYLESKFNDLQELKDKYVFLENNMFIVYITLLSMLWDFKNKTVKRQWDYDLVDMLDKINFDRKNLLWNEIQLFNTTVNKSVLNRIVTYVKSLKVGE